MTTTSAAKPCVLFLFNEEHWDNIYGPDERRELEELFGAPLQFRTTTTVSDADLANVEFIFSSWGMEKCDEAFLQRAPKLRAIFYGAGSVRCFVTDASWQRGIRVSSGARAMAITVAEFALGQIIFSLKAGWQQQALVRQQRKFTRIEFAGLYDSTVGFISLGMVARHLAKLLQSFRVKIIAYDPLTPPAKAAAIGVELCPLEDVFARADVVSIHTPSLPETNRMIRGHHIEKIRKNGTLINTARGSVVAEDELIEVLRRRPDLFALLDVTNPEPPAPDSPLYTLPNVLLTPHIAGCIWTEGRRLGRMTIDEYHRYQRGEKLEGEVTLEMMPYIA